MKSIIMRRKFILFSMLLSLTLASACNKNSTNIPDDPNKGSEPGLVFVDEFDTFDTQNWSKESHPAGWVNNELQTYSPLKVTVGKDGNRSVLILTAERKNGRITSGRINSQGKRSFKYGKIEAMIKLPKTGSGLWPAFWMMGDNNKEWPACGEIDIMEMGAKGGIDSKSESRYVNSAIHYGANRESHQQEHFAANVANDLQDGNYHLYTLEWNADRLKISVDGKEFTTFDIKNNQYMHDKFYLVFNLAAGGDFMGIYDVDGVTALPEGEKVQMMVDWVKVYK